LVKTDRMFADTFCRCWKFGQAVIRECEQSRCTT
jgi:hypothetical protein